MNIIDILKSKQRLSQEQGEALYDLDLFTLGEFADSARRERFGNKTFFNSNRHINPTNVCADVCKFCAFSANRKNPNPYTMSHKEIMEIVAGAAKMGAREIHIVSAHHPDAGMDWYMDIFKLIKEAYPSLHIKAMTAAEVDYLSRRYGYSYGDVLNKMEESGVDSMPGGGAEIFDESLRNRICKGKVSSDNWLKIHEKWHNMGHMSNATMLFGHIETRANRIDHMIRLRTLQDKSGGFNAFIPLVYQRGNNYLNVTNFLGSQEILKTMAISRLMLDNIPHIKAYWATSTISLALVAQEFGADDLDGTIQKESIQSAAGAESAGGMKLKDFIDLITTSGFAPVERDSLYNEIKHY